MTTIDGGRPWTPDHVRADGTTVVTMKRCCNGCGRELGDVTLGELQAAIAGLAMPDVRGECGCARDGKEE